jgi:phytoene synthase
MNIFSRNHAGRAVNRDLGASYGFCARVARHEARNFYPSFLLLPADRRRSMCALYAFLRRSAGSRRKLG